MKIATLISIFLLTSISSWAQLSKDDWMAEAFASEFEKESYLKYFNGEKDFLDALLSQSYNKERIDQYRERLHAHILELKRSPTPTNAKKKVKFIKSIFDLTHEKFLIKYEEETSFEDVFNSGFYNCVTASLLYAHIFEEMNIPYVVKETPNHVYLVAFSDDERVLVETTNPTEGFSKFSERYMNNFVETLVKNKMIDATDLLTYSKKELFDKYYFKSEEIDLKQLVGIQYLNQALFSYSKKNNLTAIYNAKKAKPLYNKPKLDDFINTLFLNHLTVAKYDQWLDIKAFKGLLNYRDTEFRKEIIESEFARLTSEMIIENIRIHMYDSAFIYLTKDLSDSILLSEISFIYHYEKARRNYNRGLYEMALKDAKPAYSIKPNNADAQALLIGAFELTLRSKDDFEEIDKDISNLILDHPSIIKDNTFAGLYVNIKLIKMKSYVESHHITKAKEAMLEAEKLMKDRPRITYDPSILGNCYSKLATYYFRKGNTGEARKILNRGLKFSPDQPEMIRRLFRINNL